MNEADRARMVFEARVRNSEYGGIRQKELPFSQSVGDLLYNQSKAAEKAAMIPGAALGAGLAGLGGGALAKKLGIKNRGAMEAAGGALGLGAGALAARGIARKTGLPMDIARGKTWLDTGGRVKVPRAAVKQSYKDHGPGGLGYSAYKYLEKRASEDMSARDRGIAARKNMSKNVGRIHPGSAAKWGLATGGIVGVPLAIAMGAGGATKADKAKAAAMTLAGVGGGAALGNYIGRGEAYNKRAVSDYRRDTGRPMPKSERDFIKSLGMGGYGAAVDYAYRK